MVAISPCLRPFHRLGISNTNTIILVEIKSVAFSLPTKRNRIDVSAVSTGNGKAQIRPHQNQSSKLI